MLHFSNMVNAGLLPAFFSPNDPRPAREQLQESYAHGGGVHPFEGFRLVAWNEPRRAYLSYPGDPPMRERSRAQLRDETLILFDSDWLAIVQPDGSCLITRVD